MHDDGWGHAGWGWDGTESLVLARALPRGGSQWHAVHLVPCNIPRTVVQCTLFAIVYYIVLYYLEQVLTL